MENFGLIRRPVSFNLIKKLFGRDWFVFALACAWKAGLLIFTAQPIPTGDQYFYDGAVVHALNGGNYANPSLAMVLPIAGTEVFSAYPPLHQTFLWLWMKAWGTGALSSMWFQMVVLAIYGVGLIAIFRALSVPALWSNIGCLFFFGITFLERPDTLAFTFGTWSLFAWVRAAQKGWSNAAGNGWTLIAAGLTALSTCTSLHIGALFYLWGGLMALGLSMNRRIKFPLAPLALSVVVLACLVALVKFRYTHLWAGFQEHVRETPTLAGWTVSDPAGQLKGNLLRLLRTAPGLLAVGVLCAIFAITHSAWSISSAQTDRGVVVWSGLLVAGAMFSASFGLLMQGPVAWCAYLQPLLLAIFPVAIIAPGLSERNQRLYRSLCVVLALITATRAIGMGTWGVACSLDVSERASSRLAREAFERAAPGSVVIASSAFLYEGDRHPSVRVLHADWITPHRHKTNIVDCLTALRPTTMILTQFDYYRGCGSALPALEARPEVAEIRIRNTASIRPPDSIAALSRVVQHISWAPVIVELKWR